MDERSDQVNEQLKAAKNMLRLLEESLAKTQRLIEQTRQILNQATDETKSNGDSGRDKTV
jgi:F0F1-type ATP synthase membrane subunit b/b'